MKRYYHGNRKPYVLVVSHPENRQTVQSVLEELDSRGLYLCHRGGQSVPESFILRARAVVLFVSRAIAEDKRLVHIALEAKAAEVPLICVYLDQSALPVDLQRLMYASNSIAADRYGNAELLADRLLTAEGIKDTQVTPAQRRSRRQKTLLLFLCTLLVLAAAFFRFVFPVIRQRFFPEPSAAPTAAIQTPVPTLPPYDASLLDKYGITAESLAEIEYLVLAGDKRLNKEQLSYFNWNAQVWEANIGGKPVWLLDGQELPRGTVRDLSLVRQMVNLKVLVLVNQSFEDLSPLASLKNLHTLQIFDCPVRDISPLGSCALIRQLDLQLTHVEDLAPLEGLTFLRTFSYRGHAGATLTSLNGLVGQNVSNVNLMAVDNLKDLSPLDACKNLNTLIIQGAASLRDLSALAECKTLQLLEIHQAGSLTDLSPLADSVNLSRLILFDVPVRDLSRLAALDKLQELTLHSVPVRDLTFVREIGSIELIELVNTNVRSLAFLEGMKQQNIGTLQVYDLMDDYSGLKAMKSYVGIVLNLEGRSFSVLGDALSDISTREVHLFNCRDIDFGAITASARYLRINGGNMEDLTGLEHLPLLQEIELFNIDTLTSLRGLENFGNLRRFSVERCIHLTDWESLYPVSFNELTLRKLFTLPDLERLQFAKQGKHALALENLPALKDLSFMDTLPDDVAERLSGMQISLVDMDQLVNLEPIRRLKPGRVYIPPQLEEQAAVMLKARAIGMYEVVYPQDTVWINNVYDFQLLSLKELDSLPDVLLSKVTNFTLIGGHLMTGGSENYERRGDSGQRECLIVNNDTGERSPAGEGLLTDLSRLAGLTGLQRLELSFQPLKDVQGIQYLSGLKELHFSDCPFTDASPVFTLTELESLSFDMTPVTSLAGIQNLKRLSSLNINDSQVSDISALRETDLAYGYGRGGLNLFINGIPCDDLSPLEAVKQFGQLHINSNDSFRWLPYVAGKPVVHLMATGCSITNSDLQQIAALPGLKELSIPGNEHVTDLTPLLACATLERLRVSSDMRRALVDIEGKAHFEIVVDYSYFELLSLDELDTLPDEQLGKVTNFTLIGDHLMTGGSENYERRWEGGQRVCLIVNNDTGERSLAGEGLLTDLSKLSKLTGLQRLELSCQPLEGVQGIQYLSGLKELHFADCPFTDASPVFALTQLESLSFDMTPVTSLAGIQNLKRLSSLNINNSQVSDISVLREIDLAYGYERGGLNLFINGIPCDDLSPLEAVKQFGQLHINSNDSFRWLPYVAGKPVVHLMATGCSISNSDLQQIAALPGLKELSISGNEQVTDLTPLLACATLERLRVSSAMRGAIDDIEGKASFEIIMQY